MSVKSSMKCTDSVNIILQMLKLSVVKLSYRMHNQGALLKYYKLVAVI